MKIIFAIFLPLVLLIILSFGDPLKSPTGADPGHTGSPGDGKNCTFCHGGTATNINGVFSSNIPFGGYIPGNTYTITVTTTGTQRKGFQVSPQNISGALLGTLTAGSNNQLVGNNKYVTHVSGITSSPAVWSFDWTAPQAGTGAVTFYGAFVIGQPNVRLSTFVAQEDISSSVPDNSIANLNVFPVPSTSYINTNYHLDEPQKVAVSLINLHGQQVYSMDFGYESQGDQNKHIVLDEALARGVYLLNFAIGDKTFTRKVLLQ